MKYLTQTRLHVGEKPKERGNCFPAVIACLLDLESPEDVVQFQEYYHIQNPKDPDYWSTKLFYWLQNKGYELLGLDGHLHDGSLYLVTGTSPRNADVTHICIYQNGKLLHDPHPDRTGILDEQYFEIIEPLK